MKTYLSLAISLLFAACSSPSAPEAPVVPTSVELNIRVMGVNETPAGNVDIWLLDGQNEIIEHLVSSVSGVKVDVERDKTFKLLVYESGFKLISTSIQTSHDSTLTITLEPIAMAISADLIAKWTSGHDATLSNLHAIISAGSIRLDTIHTTGVHTRIDIPIIAEEFEILFTANDCDTLKVGLTDLFGRVTPLTLTRISAIPQNDQTLNIGSAWSDFTIGLQGVTIVVQNGHQTVVTDENGAATISYLLSEPKTIEIISDNHESLNLTLPSDDRSIWIYLHPKTETLVPLFDLNIGDVWHFNLVNSSRSSGLTTESKSTIQWKLISMDMEIDGSHLLTFHSTGTGVTTHPYMPPRDFEVDDTIRIRESVDGFWTTVDAPSRYPLSWQGYAASYIFPSDPVNFTMKTILESGETKLSVRKPFRRMVPAGIVEIDANQYRMNVNGLLKLSFSQGGGNTSSGATMTRVNP